jgi:site-specific DNA-cytosine methylase
LFSGIKRTGGHPDSSSHRSAVQILTGYNVYWGKMSTVQHGGLPHHRDRLYVVGIRADVQIRAFQFPTPFPRHITLEQLLGPGVEPKKDLASMTVDADGSMLSNTVRKNLAQFQKEVSQKNLLHADWIVDCGGSKPTYMLGKCPCLILSRCKGKHGYWSQLHQRFLGPKDFFLPQGIPVHSYCYDSSKHTASTLGELAGNAMSVAVVRRIVRQILWPEASWTKGVSLAISRSRRQHDVAQSFEK